jgi:general secretion pathway protein M
MIALSRDVQRFVAVGLLLAVLLAVQAFVLDPILAAHDRLDATWARNANLLASYRRILAELETLRRAQDVLERDADSAPAYLTAPSLTLAAAELQNRLDDAVRRHGAQLIGTRVLDPIEEGGFQRVGMRVTLTASLAALQAILYELEAAVPILFVDDLTIQRQDAGTDRQETVSAPASDPRLGVSFNLSAYLRMM